MVLTDNPQNFNRYVYVLDNPTNLTDPFGLQPSRRHRRPRTPKAATTEFAGSTEQAVPPLQLPQVPLLCKPDLCSKGVPRTAHRGQ
jgi:hypothetical protein